MDIFSPSFSGDEHFVQFYDRNQDLLEGLFKYFDSDTAAIVIASKTRNNIFRKSIKLQNVVYVDADQILEKFMTGEMPNKRNFFSVMRDLIKDNIKENKKIKVYGEMVAILWAMGNKDGAIGLEELWNKLSHKYNLSVYCAYPTKLFNVTKNFTSIFEINGIIEQHKWADLK